MAYGETGGGSGKHAELDPGVVIDLFLGHPAEYP
jgi:hypothetical protein